MPNDPQPDDLGQMASFIFVGKVEQYGAATEPEVEIRPGTAIVSVGRVLRTPQSVGNITGHKVTVQLVDPHAVMVGEEAIFYANGLIYGDTVVVQEVLPPQLVTDATRGEHESRVMAAVNALPDRQLQVHASAADLVVLGTVTMIRQVATMMPGVTHHDPQWREAIVLIQSVESGTNPPQGSVSILFPGSRDVAWYAAPKLQVGQHGLFILHKQRVDELNREGYVVLHPLDFHAGVDATQIRSLLKT